MAVVSMLLSGCIVHGEAITHRHRVGARDQLRTEVHHLDVEFARSGTELVADLEGEARCIRVTDTDYKLVESRDRQWAHPAAPPLLFGAALAAGIAGTVAAVRGGASPDAGPHEQVVGGVLIGAGFATGLAGGAQAMTLVQGPRVVRRWTARTEEDEACRTDPLGEVEVEFRTAGRTLRTRAEEREARFDLLEAPYRLFQDREKLGEVRVPAWDHSETVWIDPDNRSALIAALERKTGVRTVCLRGVRVENAARGERHTFQGPSPIDVSWELKTDSGALLAAGEKLQDAVKGAWWGFRCTAIGPYTPVWLTAENENIGDDENLLGSGSALFSGGSPSLSIPLRSGGGIRGHLHLEWGPLDTWVGRKAPTQVPKRSAHMDGAVLEVGPGWARTARLVAPWVGIGYSFLGKDLSESERSCMRWVGGAATVGDFLEGRLDAEQMTIYDLATSAAIAAAFADGSRTWEAAEAVAAGTLAGFVPAEYKEVVETARRIASLKECLEDD